MQYISDEKGNVQGVIVPIELWREILSERETAYLLNSEAMKRRLLEAIQRQVGIPFEQALETWNLTRQGLTNASWPVVTIIDA